MHHAALDGMGGQVLMEAIMYVPAVPRKANKRIRRSELFIADTHVLVELITSLWSHINSQSIKVTNTLSQITITELLKLHPTKSF